MGGVVNIITRRPAGAELGGAARITAGSEGRVDAGVSANVAAGDLAALVDVGRRRVDLAPGRVAANGALSERLDASVRAGWAPGGAWELDGAVLVLDERQRWPSGGAMNDFADNAVVDAALGATFTAGAHRLRPAVHLSHFDHLARRSTLAQPIAGTGDRQTQRLLEAELLYSGRVAGTVVDGGIEVKQERITSSDGRIEGGTRTLMSAEPFVQLDWSTARISVVPGARLSWNERWGTTLTPRLAVRYRLRDDLSVRAAAGRGFRGPDFKELYLQFQNDAATPPYAVYGNPDLRPEHSTNLTTALEWTGVRLYARAQGFWNELRDFIETRPVDGGGSVAQYRYGNVARARTWGAEGEAGIVLAPLRIEAGYAYLGTEDRETGEPLLGRPEHSARLTLGMTPTAKLRTTVTALYTGATPMTRSDDGTITSEREAFARLDARLAHDLPAGLEVVLGADNVFDARPEEWADATGRRWYAGLRWNTSTFTGN
jgi:outer membrane receptor for ferrienterochelin and colicins